MEVNIIAQIIGIVAIVIWLYSIKQDNMKKICFFQMLANLTYAVQYFMLTALCAVGMNILSFVRCYLTYEYLKINKKPPKYILIVFTILVILIGAITFDSFVSLIPVVINIAYVYSIWQQDVKVTYILVLVSACLWIIFNIYFGAYTCAVGNILEIIFSFKSYKKLEIKK